MTPPQGLWQHVAHPGSVLENPSTLEAPAKESCQTHPRSEIIGVSGRDGA